ncbi:MAG: response regulator [Magnetococcales bacterium]|nr:response regulator [Magnetococcales bacterium]MBF0156279.1 response regulator [Magnetococcales bacterium]
MARILIVEDERQIREALKQVLEREGHTVRLAENGDEGVLAFCAEPSDLVICDILMPVKDGLETIEELRRLAPELPILAVSGGGPGEKAQFALDVAQLCGAVQVLAKPFSRKEILAAIDRCFVPGEAGGGGAG